MHDYNQYHSYTSKTIFTRFTVIARNIRLDARPLNDACFMLAKQPSVAAQETLFMDIAAKSLVYQDKNKINRDPNMRIGIPRWLDINPL
jgi:hypothetical protein